VGRGTIAKILSPIPLEGPRMMQSKFRPRGQTFWGRVHPRAPRGKMVGVCPNLRRNPLGGLPIQNEGISGALGLQILARAARKSDTFVKVAQETNVGAHEHPNLTDGSKLFMALCSTTGPLTNLNEWLF